MNFEQPTEPILPTTSESPETSEMASLLLKAEGMEHEIDSELSEKYGEGFLRGLSEKMNDWGQKFLEKGDTTLNWAEAKGLPIPKSKAGLYLYSGASGALGIVVPGLGVLLPLSYILYKRGVASGSNQLLTQNVT